AQYPPAEPSRTHARPARRPHALADPAPDLCWECHTPARRPVAPAEPPCSYREPSGPHAKYSAPARSTGWARPVLSTPRPAWAHAPAPGPCSERKRTLPVRRTARWLEPALRSPRPSELRRERACLPTTRRQSVPRLRYWLPEPLGWREPPWRAPRSSQAGLQFPPSAGFRTR